jgi:hypothetical protein
MKGFGFYPLLSFGSDNQINFKPTCLGTFSERKFTARNKSKVNLSFEVSYYTKKWKIPSHYASVVNITPVKGNLNADETITLNCTFSPQTDIDYCIRIPCFYSHDIFGMLTNKLDKEVRRTTFVVHGQGVYGKLTTSMDTLEFQNILVNTVMEDDITVFNPSYCDIFFSIYFTKSVIIDGKVVHTSKCTKLGLNFLIR